MRIGNQVLEVFVIGIMDGSQGYDIWGLGLELGMGIEDWMVQ